ncbi:hypothetical protein [Pseudoxanthomonas sp. UTMC 1351]|uniref:hypothetical protein n=1 Tax=Pseudoxanthomonas sp. UTMC 1351 TaxID=2695853 RepID=UPI0034D00385
MSRKTRKFARRICMTRAAGGRHQSDKIWKAMRILRRFSVADLVAVVETTTSSTVGTYASLLTRTGFLRVWRGTGGRMPASYQLVRDSGPIAPSIMKRRTVLYDHNTDTEYSLNANP